ncbi:hypothetical protein Q9L58_000637 [Maublancomyces gigas]|uniref:Uncharacterized protein n=1 Tax=Discina gigas TaxID=1032678 RepID=A0ABR3GWL7_9PEZI
MVQSPESSSTQRKRRRDDHFPDSPSDLNPWNFIPEHHPLHLLSSKFSAVPSSQTQKLKSASSRTASPTRSARQSPFSRNSPKLKRLRVSPASQRAPPEGEAEEEDKQDGEDYHMVISSPTTQSRPPVRLPERCHVCSRVQSLVMPSFGTITVCAVCDERTCYVCTRKCDNCDETVCSKCSEEKEVHSFCRRCMLAWKESRGGAPGMM